MSAPPDSLVDGGRLQAQLGDPALRVLEATVYLDPPTAPGRPYDDRSGRADWAAAHNSGRRVRRPRRRALRTAPAVALHLPGPARVATAMKRLGVGDGTSVVIYDPTALTEWAGDREPPLEVG